MTTFNIEITLPEFITFKRAGQEMEVQIIDYAADILAQAVQHGLVQTIGDAASAAASSAYEEKRDQESDPDWAKLTKEAKKRFVLDNAQLIADHGRALMEKRVAQLAEGEWTMRAAAAPGMSKFDQYCAEILRDNMTFAKGTKTADRLTQAFAKFQEQPDATQEKIKEIVKARIERERESTGLQLKL